MNNNDLQNKENQNVGTYHATANLNTAIENPEYNINNAVDVNIQSSPTIDNNNYINNDYNNHPSITATSINNNVADSTITNFTNNNNTIDETTNNTFVPNNNATNETSIDNTSTTYTPTNNGNVTYEPTMEEKKENSEKFKFTIPKELKVMLFIVFILVIFIASIPSIYDFFKDLGLIISG